MKHLRSLLVLVLALVSTSSLVVPPPQASALCTCEPNLRTTFTSSFASAQDCSTTQASMYLIFSDIAADDCAAPVCFRRLVITQPCFVNMYGNYQMAGYMEYKCRSC